VDPGYDAHAAHARAGLRAIGLADCIHYAEGRTRRADALYARLNAAGDWPLDVGLRADGTMVAIGNRMSVFESSPAAESDTRPENDATETPPKPTLSQSGASGSRDGGERPAL
jgi:hypothetical protein